MISSDFITHISNEDDKIYLRGTHFPVNMRLFNTSKKYKDIILQMCEYIRFLALTTMDGYKKPHGMSSANSGLSFNIIGIVQNRNEDTEYCKIFINPKILSTSDSTKITTSNCGSITLPNSIEVARYEWVEVSYYNEDGEFCVERFTSPTVQHEIDHNNGILITD